MSKLKSVPYLAEPQLSFFLIFLKFIPINSSSGKNGVVFFFNVH